MERGCAELRADIAPGVLLRWEVGSERGRRRRRWGEIAEKKRPGARNRGEDDDVLLAAGSRSSGKAGTAGGQAREGPGVEGGGGGMSLAILGACPNATRSPSSRSGIRCSSP